MEGRTDLELVESCLRGDSLAWEQVVGRYGRYVYNLAYRFTGRFDLAEDMAQEIFIRIYRRLPMFRKQRGEFKSWVAVMGRNMLIDQLRKDRRGWFKTGGSDEMDQAQTPDVGGTPLDHLESGEKARFVHECLAELSVDLRAALVLREIEGLSYEEVAAALKAPLGTVKSRINRGRIELARVMNMRRLTASNLQGEKHDGTRLAVPGI